MIEKSCSECRHYRRERAGPHEWVANCELHQRDFLNAEHCGLYQPEPAITENEGNEWPWTGG